MRASAVVKRQSMVVAGRRCAPPTQAATSRSSVARSASRRSRHCRASTLSSISAMFSQLPCLGVWWISSLSASRLASAGREGLVERGRRVGVELVHDQHDPLGVGVVDVDQLLDAVRPVEPGALVADAHLPPAAQRLADQEEVDHPAPHVLRVVARRAGPGAAGSGADLGQQLAAGLVQADHRARRGRAGRW